MKLYSIKCRHCQSVFLNKHKEQVYCSQKCWGSDTAHKALSACITCKKEFRPKTLVKANKYCSQECYWKWMKGNTSGDKCQNWRGGITKKDKLERGKFRNYIQKQVFERDDYTCQLCGIRGKDMTVDHIQPWAEYIELRFNISNCRTLCQSCHYEITFGKPKPKHIKSWGHNFSKTM